VKVWRHRVAMDTSISKKTYFFKTSIYTLQTVVTRFPVSFEASLYFMFKESRYGYWKTGSNHFNWTTYRYSKASFVFQFLILSLGSPHFVPWQCMVSPRLIFEILSALVQQTILHSVGHRPANNLVTKISDYNHEKKYQFAGGKMTHVIRRTFWSFTE